MNAVRGLIMFISRIPPAVQLFTILSIAVGVTCLVNSQLNAKQSEYDKKIQAAQAQLEGVDAKVVYVANDIPEGSIISSNQLEEKKINSNKVPQDAITSSALATGRIAKYGLPAGQILSQHDLAPLNVSLGFESKLPKGKRAITFAVDANSGVAGFVTPDSRVDVMSMVGTGSNTQVAPILSDVQVIAVGQIYEKSHGKTEAIPSSSVTVAVNPEDAQKLVKGIAASKIYLSLRNQNDHSPVATVDVTALFPKAQGDNDQELMASNSPMGKFELPPPPQAGDLDLPTNNQGDEIATGGPPPAPNHVIEMWSGERRATFEVPSIAQ